MLYLNSTLCAFLQVRKPIGFSSSSRIRCLRGENMIGINERMERDLVEIANDRSLVGISLERDEDDIRHLIAAIDGPESTPYEGGVFKIDIHLPAGFPFDPPLMRFITRIWHPSISSQNGEIRLNILNDWSLATRIKTILIALQALLTIPDPSDPLDDEVADQYFNDRKFFDCNANIWTMTYAMDQDEMDPPPQPSTRTSGRRRRIARNPRHFNNYVL